MTQYPEGTTVPRIAAARYALRPFEPRRLMRWQDLILPLGIAFAVRLTIVLAFLGAGTAGDENAYLNLGHGWARFGCYTGMWAPGYPWMIAVLDGVFGDQTVNAVRFVQIGLSLWVGVHVALIAAMFGGRRAGIASAWIYALYLPLASFTAMIYSETLFLSFFVPASYHLIRFAREGRLAAPWWRVPAAGALLGLSALTRESTVLFVIPSMAWIALALRGHSTEKSAGRLMLRHWGRGSGPLAMAPAALFGLAFFATILPWTARNAAAYDRFVPVAVTAGGNAYLGWNAGDFNFDLAGLGAKPPGELRAKIRGKAPEAWRLQPVINPADAMRNNVEDGLRFVAQNPVFFLRSRIVEFVDLVSPTSFIVRQFRAVEGFGEPLNTPIMRRIFALFAVLSVPLLALMALRGWATVRDAGPLRSFATMTVLCTSGVALLSGLTRFRVPMIPMLIVLAAVCISGTRERPTAARSTIASCVAVALFLAWIPSLGPTILSLSAIW